MPSRVVKKQLSEEELRIKAEQQRLKRNENTRCYRAKKRAAAKCAAAKCAAAKSTAGKKASDTKKTPQKKEASKKRVVENKIPNTTEEEYECYKEYKNKRSPSQEPARKILALKYLSIKSRFERTQKNPDIKKNPSKYDAIEPALETNAISKRTAIDDLATQYASDDDDLEEVFNTNWRPIRF